MGLAENERVTTIGERGKRVWLYPTWFRGRLLTYRSSVHALLLGLLLVGPWIDIGGHPAIFIDLPARRVYFWGLRLFATDGSYLLFLFGFVLFGVLFVTALFGRAWCGWACPQTVFLESLVRPIERLLEGPPTKRRKLDQAPWTAQKVIRKAIKLVAFAVLAGGIATTFVAYFLGRGGVLEAQADPFSHPAGTIVFLGLSGALLFDFAYFREQTCVVVCPYGRFQSVLLDGDSLGVGYDERRGEPRGKPRDRDPARQGQAAGESPSLSARVGDCVDCKRCLVVCPTGIDIRKGNQMECVQCMACIDACDDVMHKLGRRPGLIRLASENALAGRPRRFLRPRVGVYGMALVGVALAFTVAVLRRDAVELNLGRQAGAAWAMLPDGRVQNALSLRISNKSGEARTFRVTLVEPAAVTLVVPVPQIRVAPSAVEHSPVFVIAPADQASTLGRVKLRVNDDQGMERELSVEFLSRPDLKDTVSG